MTEPALWTERLGRCSCSAEEVVVTFNKRTGGHSWSCEGNCFMEPKDASPIVNSLLQHPTSTEHSTNSQSTFTSVGIQTDINGEEITSFGGKLCRQDVESLSGLESLDSSPVLSSGTQYISSGEVIYCVTDAVNVDLQPVAIIDEKMVEPHYGQDGERDNGCGSVLDGVGVVAMSSNLRLKRSANQSIGTGEKKSKTESESPNRKMDSTAKSEDNVEDKNLYNVQKNDIDKKKNVKEHKNSKRNDKASKLEVHPRTPRTKQFKCLECDKVFSGEKTLLNHTKKHNLEENEMKDETAKKEDIAKEKDSTEDSDSTPRTDTTEKDVVDIKNTKKSKRKGPEHKTFTCSKCDQVFTSNCNYREHLKTHRLPKGPHKCEYCDKVCDYLNNLRRHIRTHTKEKPFACSQCEKSFTNKGEMVIHERRHNGIKPYKCHVCENSFVKKWNLDEHMRTHTGARPYQCEFCEKSFGFKNVLKTHLVQHTGDKRHKCLSCPKRFVNKAGLDMHVRTHTGEKPFKCIYCEKWFTYKHSLKAHMKHIHIGDSQQKMASKLSKQ